MDYDGDTMSLIQTEDRQNRISCGRPEDPNFRRLGAGVLWAR